MWEAKLKGDGLVYLAQKISKQPRIKATAWVLLATFTRIYSETHKEKGDLENWRLCQKRNTYIVTDRKGAIIVACGLKKKPSAQKQT